MRIGIQLALGIAGFLTFVALIFAGVMASDHTPHGVRAAASVPSTPVPRQPMRTTSGLRSFAPVADGAVAQVYECEIQGVRTYSAQPCGPGAQRHVIRPINTYAAPPEAQVEAALTDSSTEEPPEFPTASGEGLSPELSERRPGLCADIQAQIEQIYARMRQGYGAAEGDALRAELHRLNDEAFEQHCTG